MGTGKITDIIDKIHKFLNDLIDWFKSAYYFATEYVDDPFSDVN